jgi:hypothetical protein
VATNHSGQAGSEEDPCDDERSPTIEDVAVGLEIALARMRAIEQRLDAGTASEAGSPDDPPSS